MKSKQKKVLEIGRTEISKESKKKIRGSQRSRRIISGHEFVNLAKPKCQPKFEFSNGIVIYDIFITRRIQLGSPIEN